MKFRSLVISAGCAGVVVTTEIVVGVATDWPASLVAIVVISAASMVVASFALGVTVGRRILRLLRSTNRYARLASERAAAVVSKRVSDDGDGPVMVLALGMAANDPELIRYARSRPRGEVIVITNRADLLAKIAEETIVEFVHLPIDEATAGTWLAVRLVKLAAEAGATILFEWPLVTAGTALAGADVQGLTVVEMEQSDTALAETVISRLHSSSHAVDSAAWSGRTAEMVATFEKTVASMERRATQRNDATIRELKSEFGDVYRQVESLAMLYRIFDGRPALPHLRGWAVSPDLAVDLIDLVRAQGVRTVLELGSGASTVLLALAVQSTGSGHVVSIDHDKDYTEQTRRMLEAHDLSQWATVVHAPLVAQEVDGETFRWYDLTGVSIPADIEFLFVDGPPEATGPRSRYPALPLLVNHLADDAVIILDDGRRADEQAIAAAWSEHPFVTSSEQLQHERRPIRLTFERSRDQ